MAEVTFIRNPYPLPDVVREGVWLRQPVLGSKVSPKDRDWSAKLKAHERLFAHHTLNSIRRDNRLQRSQVKPHVNLKKNLCYYFRILTINTLS